MRQHWFRIHRPIPRRMRTVLGVLSFVLPLLVWSAVSYVPFLWHPMVNITDPGGVSYLQPDMRMDKGDFALAVQEAEEEGLPPPQGYPANPIYLPAPHEVATAFFTAFSMPPQTSDGQWLAQSIWHSIQIIFWGFFISSLIGVPLGILCGTYAAIARLNEPFIEFFRYLPAPAFGALAVAIACMSRTSSWTRATAAGHTRIIRSCARSGVPAMVSAMRRCAWVGKPRICARSARRRRMSAITWLVSLASPLSPRFLNAVHTR